MNIKIGNRNVGDGHKTFIVFEAGATHTGVESSKKLIDVAKESNADAIKFQVINAERLMCKDLKFTYSTIKGEITEPLIKILKRRELSQDEWREVKEYADKKNIIFFATADFPENVDLLVELNSAALKVASADIDNIPLIKYVAKTGLPVILDTGGAAIGEIEYAIDVIRNEGNENYMIMHCPRGYPAKLDKINLKMIKSLKELFQCPIGFSDHTPGYHMDVAALALGANAIEKTITLSRNIVGPEHIMSLEPHETKDFVKILREVELGMGNTRFPVEINGKRGIYRRSITAKRKIKKGDIIREEMLDYRRPGYGISPKDVNLIIGSIARRDIEEGEILTWDVVGMEILSA